MQQRLSGKKIILGLSGGIACYKAAELTRLLIKAGATVHVVMTEAATHFMTSVTMQALSGQPVWTDQWDARIANNMPHIDLTRDADAIVIAPCSTDFIFKLAHGACNDLLSTLCIARPAAVPLLIAPAMNVEMWQNPACQRNVAQLRADGIHVLGPGAGAQACGETGMGRMLEAADLLSEIIASFAAKSLRGKHLLITAGPTFEAIDPVRGITNLSSGKMGYALATAAWEAGAAVTLVSGPTALERPYGVQRIDVQSAQQMYDAVLQEIRQTPDVFIAVAAVADWRVANASTQKLKKTEDCAAPQLLFETNPDILASVAALPQPPYCVGFAAESERLLEYGAAKRLKKQIPLLVGNIGHQTFGQDDNELVLFDATGHRSLARADKATLARALVADIAARLSHLP
ncbi:MULTISPECIES: bifunctional phosphopantothenoylcysteine decarboxylase/phosphopantothenate--cysteine ligase CoaBC [unclassified Undibacterium]|uniref:bifunctional phosphopantothenoylcysteine decarboxylase/phosphopantothenate--cysteine ligase CoaBC n=1 Tax=unclassified Undibacterium TaxID=2630295 RepID=UPI002AC91168|nr:MULTISPECIES: bifunctional phosphopantothenoylcysteine decarboxylase/phosphopantothenate--cysteine ligase CoaBC [unclassified Undibacterium]MEB0139108.1 bifunctional phosphopantothenoylcysteine decarboxylase/phosphopantothenate--cysteine ligase CoaBC [Undibacterium sp. CCC2.1]MEB0173449.1 bifunctional phosphopantothenoylcysteine decarboxylase/phosphopantothenate--cysteine ligase CoaBC [Undibacterium sp. CCC1.1]MEB0177183.1 bifunctional phosphopantothenoylcysteine decarboxylase/phosphopantothe